MEPLHHVYSLLLLAIWVVYLHKTLTPRYSACVTIPVCAAAAVLCYLISDSMPRSSLVRLLLIPTVFLLLAFLLFRGRTMLTLFVALAPEMCVILLDTSSGLLYPALVQEHGYEQFWSDPVCIPISFVLAAMFALLLFLLNRLVTRGRQTLTASQWFLFTLFPLFQTACFVLLLRLYYRTPTASSWVLVTAEPVVFTVVDIVLLRVIRETAGRAELEATNRMLKMQLDDQLKHYKALTQQYEDNRRMRHDIAHHMHTIRLLLENSRHQEATDYANELLRQQSHDSQLGQCENPVVDAFLYSRVQEAQQLHIPVDADVLLPAVLPIPNVDLIILFGNLMDNAMESCAQVQEPYIRLSARVRKGYLTVTQSNPVPAEKPSAKKRRIPELERGVGLHILEDLARRHDGSCTCGTENDVFTISVALKMTEGTVDADVPDRTV